jgi:UDPglucose 6-dehydrogenase
LLEGGADIYAYDPVGTSNFAQLYPEGKCGNGSITYVHHPEDALREANLCFIFTEWKEIRSILPLQYNDWMRTPIVFDGRNIYCIHEMADAKVEYHSVGRKTRWVNEHNI